MPITCRKFSPPESSEKEREVLQQLGEVFGMLHEEAGIVTERFYRRAVRNPSTALFVARNQDTGKIVGTVVVNLVFMFDDTEGRIDNVAVLEMYRGRGIARALLLKAIAYCRSNGAWDIELTCAPHREAAGKLYESLGFTKRDTRVYKMKLRD